MGEDISASDFDDESYLKPVLADDGLLLCLDDLPTPAAEGQGVVAPSDEPPTAAAAQLLAKNAELQQQLEQLAKQFDNYRLAVQQTLDRRWEDNGASSAEGSGLPDSGSKPAAPAAEAPDGYFQSYGHNGMYIHY